MKEEILNLLNHFFESKRNLKEYSGNDKYSSITTNYSEEYIKISKEYFDSEFELENALRRIEGHWQDYIGQEFYWALKTWADIHFMVKDNPSRMICCPDLSTDYCSDLMKLCDVAETHLKQIILK